MNQDIEEYIKEESAKIYATGLVIKDFGNTSIRFNKKILIKASGKPMATISKEDFVYVDFNGNVLESDLRPSSDTPTHI